MAKIKEPLTFKSLAGAHKLTGIECGAELVSGESVNNVIFILDGKKYKVTEDPSDGYRSSANGPEIVKTKVKNTFLPVFVLAKHRTKTGYSGEDDILELSHIKTGETILEVGTSNIDDYYPSFVCNFSAEALGPVKVENAR